MENQSWIFGQKMKVSNSVQTILGTKIQFFLGFFLDSVLSMDIPSTGPSGPTSLRSEMGEDMEPIVEEK